MDNISFSLPRQSPSLSTPSQYGAATPFHGGPQVPPDSTPCVGDGGASFPSAEKDACLLHHISNGFSRGFRIIAHAAHDIDRTSDPDRSSIYVLLGHVGVKIKKMAQRKKKPTPGIKCAITYFSEASKRRLLEVCRESGHHIQSQFCLSYHDDFPLDGRQVKADLDRFEYLVKKHFGRETHMLWALEFQKRGAPHIHFFSDIEATRENRLTLTILWICKVLGYSPETPGFRVHNHAKNFQGWKMRSGQYLVKEYIEKMEQKDVPENFLNVGRFWGHSRNMKPKYEVLSLTDNPLWNDCLKRAIRAASKYQEKTKDAFLALRLQVEKRKQQISEMFPDLEWTAQTLKPLWNEAKALGTWKTSRLCPRTNIRGGVQSYTIYHGALIFKRVFAAGIPF